MNRFAQKYFRAHQADQPAAMPDGRSYARFYFWWPTSQAVGFALEGSS